jgi:hypothetical protein
VVLRTFVLRRNFSDNDSPRFWDIAEGVQFSSGTVVIQWRGEHDSTVIWPHINDVIANYGQDGTTQVVWS